MMSIGSETCEENNWLLVQVEGISAVLGENLEEKDYSVCNGWDMISLCTADSILEAKGTFRDVDSLYLRNQPNIPRRCLGDQQGEGEEESGSSILDSFPTASKSIHTAHNNELPPLKDTLIKSCRGDEGEFMNPKQGNKNRREASKNDREKKMKKKAEKKEKKKRENERKKRKVLESFFASDSEDDGSVRNI